MWEAYGRKKNNKTSKLWEDYSKFRKPSTPNAKGGAVLLNILVFLNSNTCSAPHDTQKRSYLLLAPPFRIPSHYKFISC